MPIKLQNSSVGIIRRRHAYTASRPQILFHSFGHELPPVELARRAAAGDAVSPPEPVIRCLFTGTSSAQPPKARATTEAARKQRWLDKPLHVAGRCAALMGMALMIAIAAVHRRRRTILRQRTSGRHRPPADSRSGTGTILGTLHYAAGRCGAHYGRAHVSRYSAKRHSIACWRLTHTPSLRRRYGHKAASNNAASAPPISFMAILFRHDAPAPNVGDYARFLWA